MDRLCFGGALWFHVIHSRVLIKSRSQALKGIYDDANWASTSYDILRTFERCGARFHVSGLDHLRDRGLSSALLYVDADNTAAISLYRSLGFAPWDSDTLFRR